MQVRREAQFAARVGDGRGARARWSSYRLGQLGALALGAPRALVLSAVGSFFSAGPPAAVRAVAMRVASEPGVLLTLARMIRAFLLGQGPSAKPSPSRMDTDLARARFETSARRFAEGPKGKLKRVDVGNAMPCTDVKKHAVGMCVDREDQGEGRQKARWRDCLPVVGGQRSSQRKGRYPERRYRSRCSSQKMRG